jgi:hypothetical protein
MKRVEWGTGGNAKDDFSVKTEEGYVLRVEQMDRGAWWWTVYYPDGMSARDGTHCEWLDAPNKLAAMYAAEMCYRQHLLKQ